MRVALSCLFFATACSGWPAYVGDDHEDTETLAPGEDPRRLVDIDWETLSEAELEDPIEGVTTDNPATLPDSPLEAMEGVVLSGTLDGIGWNSGLEPLQIATFCEDELQTVARDPGQPGDWTGDVDFIRFSVAEATSAAALTLCARASFTEADIGIDLLLYRLDPCGLPGAPLTLNGAVLGSGLYGEAVEWKAPLSEPGDYAIGLAGYLSPEPDASYDYVLGVSLVPSAGGFEICPLLPTEVES
jgi:hypothetical protein